MRIFTKSVFLFLLIFGCSISFFGNTNPKKTLKPNNGAISFTENKGQVSDQNSKPRADVLFGGSANGMVFHLRNNGVSYQLNRIDSWKEEPDPKTKEQRKVADKSTVYRLELNWLNCNTSAQILKENALPGFNNYYTDVCPNGVHGVKSYGQVTYQNIYKGIDLKWYQKEGALKYDYLVAAGADYKQIQIEIKGSNKISLNAKGDLIIKTPLGNIIEQAPLVKQNGSILKSKWIIKNSIISFNIENLNPNQDFIIDPIVRVWGTYYGGSNDDIFYSITTDSGGNIFACGVSNSSSFIATVGSHQSVFGGANDAFLVKFNVSGVRQWGTYYGSAFGQTYGLSCCNDPLGNVYMSGQTAGNPSSVIATPGSHQPIDGGFYDDFLVKFNTNGIRQWATFYGGDGGEDLGFCCTDLAGNVYLCGTTSSTLAIATPGSHQYVKDFSTDAFLVKFNSSGVRQWGTYYGGIGGDGARCCVTDTFGNVYIAGETGSATMITTMGCHQINYAGGNQDAFLVKFNSLGVRQWGTYYGGASDDWAWKCTTDLTGNVYVVGSTRSNNGTEIATVGSHQPTHGGGVDDGYLVKFNAAGVRQWGTYYGGIDYDYVYGCVTENGGNIYISGRTATGIGTAIATPGSYQPLFGGGQDAFVAKFDPSGMRQWGTYYGGTSTEFANSCATDIGGNIYFAGVVYAGSGTIIASPGSHQPTYSGGVGDGFLVQFGDCPPPAPANITPILNQTICVNNSATLTALGSGTVNWFANPTGGVSLGTGQSFVTPTLGLGTYTYYAEANTCSVSANRTPITCTVNPNPNITVNSGAICFGNSFTISPLGALSYTFQGGSAIVSPTASISYSVIGTNSFGCVSSTAAVCNITVNALPNVSSTTSSTLLCVGEAATLTASGAVTYSWNPGNPGISIVVFPAINTTFTITGTDANGCINTSIITQNVSLCLDIKEHNSSNYAINIYPNPFCNKITIIANEIKQPVQILNILGSILYKGKIENEKTEIDLSLLSAGIYFIRVGTYTQKIVKE